VTNQTVVNWRNRFRHVYNTIRPHQVIRDRTREAYLNGS